MRQPADAARVRAFIEALGRRSDVEATVYLVGGATAVLLGWRATTRVIDLRIEPETATGSLGDHIVDLKEVLAINVELSSPLDFLPELPGWRDRSPFIETIGLTTFRHLDAYAQALAKVRRGVEHDRDDVAAMLERRIIQPARAWQLYEAIRPNFARFPAIDEPSFRARMTDAFGERDSFAS